MIYRVFTVRDNAVQAFMTPFFMRSNAEAVRAMRDTMSDGKNLLSRHPADYFLYCLGLYSEEDGKFQVFETPEIVVALADLVERPVQSVPDGSFPVP